MRSSLRWAAVLSLGFPTLLWAAPWTFDEPIDVTTAHGERVFHHADAAGRKSIAARDGVVGVVWEDNRDGVPRCYFASKSATDTKFNPELRLSDKDECYEPAVAALSTGRFIAVWEEGGRVRARIVSGTSAGDAILLSEQESVQASIGIAGDVVYAVWAEKAGRFSRVRLARLSAEQSKLTVVRRDFPDETTLKDDQSFPTIAPAQNGAVVVAWEDRRNGHTFIVHTYSADGIKFSPTNQINETRNAAVPQTNSRTRDLGRGPGAMRAALARQDEQRVAIVWMDKRDFLSGYDIYIAFSTDGGRSFGKNQKVQDSFGDTFAQWNPAIAAQSEQLAVVWDDDRDNSPDLWLSWPEDNGWSDDIKPAGASGPGVQSHPSIALDNTGDLHLVWHDKPELNAPTRLRYARGRKP